MKLYSELLNNFHHSRIHPASLYFDWDFSTDFSKQLIHLLRFSNNWVKFPLATILAEAETGLLLLVLLLQQQFSSSWCPGIQFANEQTQMADARLNKTRNCLLFTLSSIYPLAHSFSNALIKMPFVSLPPSLHLVVDNNSNCWCLMNICIFSSSSKHVSICVLFTKEWILLIKVRR